MRIRIIGRFHSSVRSLVPMFVAFTYAQIHMFAPVYLSPAASGTREARVARGKGRDNDASLCARLIMFIFSSSRVYNYACSRKIRRRIRKGGRERLQRFEAFFFSRSVRAFSLTRRFPPRNPRRVITIVDIGRRGERDFPSREIS